MRRKSKKSVRYYLPAPESIACPSNYAHAHLQGSKDVLITVLLQEETGGMRRMRVSKFGRKSEWEEVMCCRYRKRGMYTHFVMMFSNNMPLSKHPFHPDLEAAIKTSKWLT